MNHHRDDISSLLDSDPAHHDDDIPTPNDTDTATNRISKIVCEKKFAYLLALLTFVSMVIGIPILIYYAFIHQDTNTGIHMAFYSAGIFVIFTIPISIYEIFLHLTHWYMPDVQKYVVRVLWMVPIYSLQSWLSLRFHNASVLLDTIRGVYEAYVICSFVYYLIGLMGGEASMAETLRKKNARYGQHSPRILVHLGVCKDWSMGEEFLIKIKHGVLQYVVLKTLLTVVTVILEATGLYREDSSVKGIDWKSGYFYVAIFMNFSISYALYCLVKLFYAIKGDLTSPVNWHPAGKFICIKGIVFFTFWQGVLIHILQTYGIINPVGNKDATFVSGCVQDYLICVEMLFFAIAHRFTFTYKEYVSGGADVWETNSVVLSSGGGDGDDGDRDDYDNGGYRPPVIRHLYEPMSFSQAFWSSTVPNETLSDIAKMSTGNGYTIVKQENEVALSTINAESI